MNFEGPNEFEYANTNSGLKNKNIYIFAIVLCITLLLAAVLF